VDDEKELCQSIDTFVNGAPGFRCLNTYHSGEAALEHLPQDRPDVVLMDTHFAGMSGIACIERLKAKIPQMQIR
jgi:DNA-binding NarL/FixJ family response regulator